jgi:hypothetical protein
MADPDKFSRWIKRKETALNAWDERRTAVRRHKALTDMHTFEMALALCGGMLILGLVNHMNVTVLRSACALAAIVVFLKFVQFTLIAIHRGEGSNK